MADQPDQNFTATETAPSQQAQQVAPPEQLAPREKPAPYVDMGTVAQHPSVPVAASQGDSSIPEALRQPDPVTGLYVTKVSREAGEYRVIVQGPTPEIVAGPTARRYVYENRMHFGLQQAGVDAGDSPMPGPNDTWQCEHILRFLT